jgi:RNA polymerase sigma-70 factor (ECF subfamily)
VDAVVRAVWSPGLAADALDEAFTRAFAGWERVQAMRSPAGWVYRVAVNEARRQLPRATREEALLAALGPRPPAPPPGGETWLLVGDLPVRQRAAVVLRHVAGLTEADVGAAMGVTRSTVSSSLAAAYRTLATKLDADDDAVAVPVAGETAGNRAPRRRPDVPAPRTLAVARACHPNGCDVEPLDGGDPFRAAYSDAMLDVIKVRPGDLVAIDPVGPTVVWRWWSGTVEAVAAGGTSLTVSRNVTQRLPDDARRSTMEVGVPAELVGGLEVGEIVWFGHESDAKVVVAVQGIR